MGISFRTRSYLAILLSFLLCASASAASSAERSYFKSLLNDKKLVLLSQGEGSLLSEKKTRVIYVWASWCPYCDRVRSILEKKRPIMNKRGVEIVGISIDEIEEKAAHYADSRKSPIPMYYYRGDKPKQPESLKVIPIIGLVDANGRLISVQTGSNEARIKSIEQSIELFVSEEMKE